MAASVRSNAFGADLRIALESEQALLGCCMFDPMRFREVAHIRSHHFFVPQHAVIWDAIGLLIRQGDAPNIATLTDRLGAHGSIAELGGGAFLFDLFDKCGPPNLARQHAQTVLEAYARRTGVTMLNDGTRTLMGAADRPAHAIFAEMRHELERLESDASTSDRGQVSAIDGADALFEAMDFEAEHGIARGCSTGLRCFDLRLGGLRPGWLITIGARPSMGKSGLMRCAAYGAAALNQDKLFLIFSLEMDVRELTERALSAASHVTGDGIPYKEFAADMDENDRRRLRDLRDLMPENVLIDDRSYIGVDDIARAVWAAKAKRPVGAVFVDYLQLLARPLIQGRSEALLLGDITRALKTLAREAETCIVLVSQLNRSVETRDDKRPQLADLRDSGSIEQDSNAVLFPYRRAHYLERAEPDPNSASHHKWQTRLELVRRRMDVVAAKVRGGPTGVDRQVYFAEFDYIGDLQQ